jgi:hypothetical protein
MRLGPVVQIRVIHTFSVPPHIIRGAVLNWWEEPVVRLLASQVGFPVLQERPYPLVPIPAHSSVFRPLQFDTRFSVNPVLSFNYRVVGTIEPRALHDAADAYESKQQSHEGEVGHLQHSLFGAFAAVVFFVPALPVFPCSVVPWVGGPSLLVELPVVGIVRGGGVLVADPAYPKCIICSPLLAIRQDFMRSNKHAVSLKADRQRDAHHWRIRETSVRVVQLHQSVETVLCVGFAFVAPEDLVRRGGFFWMHSSRPVQQACISLPRLRWWIDVLCVGSLLPRKCMTA